jgi:hypothetical protein
MGCSRSSDLEMGSVSSCVPEVAIRRFRVAKLSRPETCLRSSDTCGAHTYLATLANYHKEQAQSAPALWL